MVDDLRDTVDEILTDQFNGVGHVKFATEVKRYPVECRGLEVRLVPRGCRT